MAMMGVLLATPVWAKDVEVRIKEFMYNAKSLTVPVGTTVTWINDDDTPHTVTEKHKLFRSAALDTKDKYFYTFKKRGKFEYFCTLHPNMVGTITVTK